MMEGDNPDTDILSDLQGITHLDEHKKAALPARGSSSIRRARGPP